MMLPEYARPSVKVRLKRAVYQGARGMRLEKQQCRAHAVYVKIYMYARLEMGIFLGHLEDDFWYKIIQK